MIGNMDFHMNHKWIIYNYNWRISIQYPHIGKPTTIYESHPYWRYDWYENIGRLTIETGRHWNLRDWNLTISPFFYWLFEADLDGFDLDRRMQCRCSGLLVNSKESFIFWGAESWFQQWGSVFKRCMNFSAKTRTCVYMCVGFDWCCWRWWWRWRRWWMHDVYDDDGDVDSDHDDLPDNADHEVTLLLMMLIKMLLMMIIMMIMLMMMALAVAMRMWDLDNWRTIFHSVPNFIPMCPNLTMTGAKCL